MRWLLPLHHFTGRLARSRSNPAPARVSIESTGIAGVATSRSDRKFLRPRAHGDTAPCERSLSCLRSALFLDERMASVDSQTKSGPSSTGRSDQASSFCSRGSRPSRRQHSKHLLLGEGSLSAARREPGRFVQDVEAADPGNTGNRRNITEQLWCCRFRLAPNPASPVKSIGYVTFSSPGSAETQRGRPWAMARIGGFTALSSGRTSAANPCLAVAPPCPS
jgi:hypothetical protein